MKRWLQNVLAYVAGILLAALVLEAILRLLPVPMGLYRTEQYQRWPLVNYEPHRQYTSSMSWELRHPRHGSTNNYGHLAPFDYVPGSKPVIVVGDSFVDSQMNQYEETLQGQLGALLGRREAVYGLGANGLSISDYLAVSQMAAAEFAPSAAVLLIVDGDVSESLIPQIGHYYFTITDDQVELKYWPLYGETASKKLRRLIGDSALYRYVQVNLLFSPARLLERALSIPSRQANAAAPRQGSMQSSEEAAVDHFLGHLPSALNLPASCVVLLFNSDTFAIYDRAAATRPIDSPRLIEYFRARARAIGIRVVELEDRFRSNYSANGKHIDYWPFDRHLNGLGHGIAARAAYEALFSDERQACRPGSDQPHAVRSQQDR